MNSSITRLSLWKNNFGIEGAEASPQQNRCEVSMDVLQFDTTICIVDRVCGSGHSLGAHGESQCQGDQLGGEQHGCFGRQGCLGC